MSYQKSKATKSKKSYLKPVIIMAIIVAFVIGTLVLLEARGVINLYSKDVSSSDTTSDQGYIDYTPPTEEELQATEDEKINNIDNTTNGTIVDEKVTIDEAYYDTSTSELVVKTKLFGLNWSSCNLIASSGSATILKESKTIYQPEYSTCQGFAIPRSEFQNSGEWTIQLSAATINGDTLSSQEIKVTVAP